MNVSLNLKKKKKKDNSIEYANLKRRVNKMKSTVQKCKNQHKQYNEKCKHETAQSRHSFLLPNSNK